MPKDARFIPGCRPRILEIGDQVGPAYVEFLGIGGQPKNALVAP